LRVSENGHFGRFCSVLPKCSAPNQTTEPTPSASARPKPKVQTTLRFLGFYISSLSNIYYGRGGVALRGRVPISRPKSVSCARFGHVLYVIQHQFVSHNKRLIMTSGRRGNGGSKTRLQNGCFWRTEKWGIFWSWVFEMEWVRRHRLIMSGLMMRAQIGVQKSTGKIREN
jgi:hypothetical protein